MQSDVPAVFLLLFFCKLDYAYCNTRDLHSSFVVHANTREVSALPISVQKTRSEIECAGICQLSDRCKAANYMESEQTCYLFTQSCVVTKDISGWSFLTTIPLPRVPERSFTYIAERKSWIDAKAYCKSTGGDLANIYEASDVQRINDTMARIGGGFMFWLAGNDNETEGLWLWSNGCPIGNQFHHLWGRGEPNNCCDGQNCLRMQGTYDRFDWDDVSCLSEHAFMCEIVIE